MDRLISEKSLLDKIDEWKGFDTVTIRLSTLRNIVKAIPSAEPTVAQERYEDLCEYFGGAKDILNNREDFKAWLGRIKWHIHKAEELYEKYEQEPKTGHCKDCKHFSKLPYHADILGKCVNHWGFCPKGDWYCADFEPQESEEV